MGIAAAPTAVTYVTQPAPVETFVTAMPYEAPIQTAVPASLASFTPGGEYVTSPFTAAGEYVTPRAVSYDAQPAFAEIISSTPGQPGGVDIIAAAPVVEY